MTDSKDGKKKAIRGKIVEVLLFAETVETHQRSITIWSKAAARVAVGQRKNGKLT